MDVGRTTPSGSLIRGRDRKDRGARGHGPLQRLYRGETRFDFVGRRRVWFTISTVIIVAGIISIILRGGLNLGIEFKGGTEWTVKAPHVTQTQAINAMQAAGLTAPDRRSCSGRGAINSSTCRPTSTSSRRRRRRRSRSRSKQAIAKLIDTSVENVAERRRRPWARRGARPSPTRPSRRSSSSSSWWASTSASASSRRWPWPPSSPWSTTCWWPSASTRCSTSR